MTEKNKIPSWRKLAIIGGIVAIVQFLVLTTAAIWVYDGGTLHNPEYVGYDFWNNFFSDLGRTVDFRRNLNTVPHWLFKIALSVCGVALIFFFFALPGLFQRNVAKSLSIVAALFGLVSAVSYIGIANIPWNIDYWGHVSFVRLGFLAFLMVTVFYALAILLEPGYPNKYAAAFLVFAIILGIQIVLMFFGPRAYRSAEALHIQVVAQKVVVYAQILCLLYQVVGAREQLNSQTAA